MGKYKRHLKEIRDSIAAQIVLACRERHLKPEDLIEKTHLSARRIDRIIWGNADGTLNHHVLIADALGKKIKITFE